MIKQTRQKRIYGCEEITIGFYNNGHGNEVVDFMTMDSKGIIKCYELKVTLQDLKSDAKKSWYGHYNYLVVGRELYEKVSDWNEYIPNNIGIIVGVCLESKRKAKRCDISSEIEIMLKESMIRSMFWKMQNIKMSRVWISSDNYNLKSGGWSVKKIMLMIGHYKQREL